MSIETRTEPMIIDAVEPVAGEHSRMVERELEAEFSGLLGPDDIQRLAAASLSHYEGAPVRTFVPILAIRTARRLARAQIAADNAR
jgi:hypothetical protein